MTLAVSETDDIAACLAVRRAVFIVEQGIAEDEDVDGLDDQAVHFLAHEAGTPLGTLRILFKDRTGKIGRLAVLPAARGKGAGVALMNAALSYLERREDIDRAYLSAQSYAIGFYEALGFSAYGEDYDDVGIPHRDMERAV